MRVGFFGTPDLAVPSLRALLASERTEVAVVVTNPDRPGGRGMRLRPPPVKEAALAVGVPVWQPHRPRDVADELRALALDACAVVAYGALLPPAVLSAAGAGFVNLHFSLLPAWRGAAPVQHTLLAGAPETGVSCFVLDEGMDTGPVLSTLRTPVGSDETAGELAARLAVLGAPLLVDAVVGLVDGTLVPVPQDDAAASHAPKIRPEDAALDWRAPADQLARAVRAYNPVPGAHTWLGDLRVKVHRATAVEGRGPAGRVISAEPVVACGRSALRLDEVQPAGKPRMSGRDFVNGYPVAGAVLTTAHERSQAR